MPVNIWLRRPRARYHIGAITALALVLTTPALRANDGKIVRIKMKSAALENTVTGESPERHVSIYLPPSYETASKKRYAVLYLLHGIGDTDEVWTTGKEPLSTIQSAMNTGIVEKCVGEMIIVMPDERTHMFGSFYCNSSVTGNWEDFTVKDLVSFVDSNFRTIARAASRGIAGHSMGGFGAITLAMKRPDVFQVVYALNPGVLGWSADLSIKNSAFETVLSIKNRDELLKAGMYPMGITCVAQAFSPNPKQPPFFVDYPFKIVNGKLQPNEPAYSQWEDHFPLNLAKKYRANLAGLRGLRVDSGVDDEFTHIPPTCRALSFAWTNLGIDHTFEEYNGDHRNRLPGRDGRMFAQLLPYFSRLLEREKE